MGNRSQPRRSRERPRDRLGRFLRDRYHGPTALAADLEVTVKRAENLMQGHWPADDLTLLAIFRRFGDDFKDAVFGPDIDETRARLASERRALEESLARVDALDRAHRGGGGSDLEPASPPRRESERTAP